MLYQISCYRNIEAKNEKEALKKFKYEIWRKLATGYEIEKIEMKKEGEN